ncbi:hypothetical protein FA13DRAFT_1741404 [Coprinellus micaceus]|uniref:Uncharacterized protein n=1 Tax=Coprinellus micaceus TaxID=71717 RepID=A0A4Y7SJN3_COPMI|nr:hypothetical protein FA13DRAFT_1741404 [Coprinellus micaceus]
MSSRNPSEVDLLLSESVSRTIWRVAVILRPGRPFSYPASAPALVVENGLSRKGSVCVVRLGWPDGEAKDFGRHTQPNLS